MPPQLPVSPANISPAAIPGWPLPHVLRAADAVPTDWQPPREVAAGKSSSLSLLQPQLSARLLLPAAVYSTMFDYATRGVPADCGPDWPPDIIAAAKETGPHVSALSPENVRLIWDELDYQLQAGFIRCVPEDVLFRLPLPPNLKLSRVAVVPQRNRRGRLILNLSAPVLIRTRHPQHRRSETTQHPSVNETTVEAVHQRPVKDLGTALPSLLFYLYDTPPSWTIRWAKVDLSDGFWRMIVRTGQEYNFVYEVPPRPDTPPGRWYVVPSSLQMGWKNSPAYFCEASDAGRILAQRFLALTLPTGSILPHELEYFAVGPDPTGCHTRWTLPTALLLILRVYIDDFITGVAGPTNRPTQRLEETWVIRAILHAIHALFPGPTVSGHVNGRDSISRKKLEAGDALFDVSKTILGFLFSGSPGALRTLSLPADKAESYIAAIDAALLPSHHYILRRDFERLHGKLNFARSVIPCLGAFMAPFNTALSTQTATIGLAIDSPLRAAMVDIRLLLSVATSTPFHITELVGSPLPHVYGYTDACQTGMGGVLLPCTRWLPPLVWRVPFPATIQTLFASGALSINDLEIAATFISDRLIEHHFQGDCVALNSWLGTDNQTTASWKQKQAPSSSARSHFAPQILRAEAILQRHTRRGPQDIQYVEGSTNLMADFPSRSFDEFPNTAAGNAAFLLEFSHRHPLPLQLGRWRLVHPTNDITCPTFSMLQTPRLLGPLTKAATGDAGLNLPSVLASTLFCTRVKAPPTTWNESSCSWPLLSPSGEVSSTLADLFQERKSRARFANADSSWSPTDLLTHADSIRPTTP